jgi:hypothetical protein
MKRNIDFDHLVKFYDSIKEKKIRDISNYEIHKLNIYLLELTQILMPSSNFNKLVKKIARYYQKKLFKVKNSFSKQRKSITNTLFS